MSPFLLRAASKWKYKSFNDQQARVAQSPGEGVSGGRDEPPLWLGPQWEVCAGCLPSFS